MSVDNETLLQKLNDEMTDAVLGVTIFVGLEVFLAFFGNLLVLYVFLFRYHHCNFRYFVLCLAVTDITSSLTTMPGEMVTQLYWYMYPVPEICKIKSFFNVFTVASEALCLLTIGIDRYLKVCRPLGRQMKPQHAKYLCVIIYMAATVLAIPVSIFWGTHDNQKEYRNTTITVTVCEKDGNWLHTNHPLQYTVALEVIISVSLVIMFGLYVFIARKILQNRGIRLRAYTLRGKHTSSSSNNSSSPIAGNSPLKSRDYDNSFKADKENWVIDTNDENIIDADHRQEIPIERVDGVTESNVDNINSKANGINTDANSKSHRRQDEMVTTNRCMNRADGKHPTSRGSGQGKTLPARVRRKTLITFILTVVFIITTIMYLTLLSYIANSVLDTLSNSQKAVYFFFFRLYFINHVINPIVYGLLDPQFREVMKNIRTAKPTTGAGVS